MITAYGPSWSFERGTKAVDERGRLTEAALTWANGLDGYTPEEIGRGLKATEKHHPDRPPTLFQFKRLCRPPEPAAMHRNFPPSLPEPAEHKEARRERGREALQGIKDLQRRNGGRR